MANQPSLADAGTVLMQRRAVAARMRAAADRLTRENDQIGGASFGWVSPPFLYSQIKNLDVSADSLEASFSANVLPTDPTRVSWEAWYKAWKDYVQKRTVSDYDRFANLTRTDDMQKEIDTYRSDLTGYYAKYEALKDANGNTVPSPSGVVPPKPDVPGKATPPPSWWPSWLPQIEVPWWVWALSGVASVGLVYVGYRYVKYQVIAARTGVSQTKHYLLPFVAEPPTREEKSGRDTDTLHAGGDHSCSCGGR